MQDSGDDLPQTSPRPRVWRVALTGGIATGKSHVLAAMARAGVPVLDTDTLAHEAVAPGTPGLAAVVARFGESVLDAGGSLNRRALADIVFTDAGARRELEGIIHPRVRAAAEQWFTGLNAVRHHFAVIAIPLLYETGRERDFDAVVVTSCSPATQLERLMRRDALSEEQARRRIDAQLPMEEKVRRADYVVNTEGEISQTNADVLDLVARLGDRRDT